ncbi:MAG: COX15/CtaA family protein [Gemmatimonadota bacterium]
MAHRSPLALWFWSIAGMTLLVLMVGGITRLTQSGLSIVDWSPFMGVVPPLSEVGWQEAFDAYRRYPEYLELRRGMTLDEFKFIYFWEYLHRLLARAIGLVFLVPFLYFAARGALTRPLAVRSLALFGLGAAQGVMGWLMVQSGLVDQPHVSHFRLAAHLSLAFVIFGYAVWMAREMGRGGEGDGISHDTRSRMVRGLGWVGGLFALQVVWGAFVAGLKAGLYHNTFPLMAGRLIPPQFLRLEPALLNFVQNPVTVQWVHRVLGTIVLVATAVLFFRLASWGADRGSRILGGTLLVLMTGQYLLGIVTLLLSVPVSLGVAHQALAMIILGAMVWWAHRLARLSGPPPLDLKGK